MNYYLSSFKLGSKPADYYSLLDSKKTIAYSANALDHVIGKKDDWLQQHIADDLQMLEALDLNVRVLDLRDYFAKPNELLELLKSLSGLWLSGGNVFVLRQAMKLSGLDAIISTHKLPDSFVYAGYSAAACVLSPTLKPYQEASDPQAKAYSPLDQVIWEGLAVFDFAFMPHFQSNHSESESINTEIDYCIKNTIPYKTFCDGEVLILQK